MLLSLILSILTAANGLLTAATAPAGCEASDETRQALKRLDIRDLTGEKRKEKQRTILEELLAQRPDDLFLHLRYQQIARGGTEAERKAVIERYKSLADQHPGNTQYLYLYANASVDTDTAQAIERLKKIVSTEPRYPWAHLELADIYGWGKFANHPEMRAQLDSFYSLCPASLNGQGLSLLGRYATPDMAAKHAGLLRERLMKETDPDRLKAWETVWNLEFKAHPPTEHAQVRKLLAADLGRVQQGPQDKDVSWLSFLKSGYKMLGDEAGLRRIEDRILAEYADSRDAKMLRRERWSKEHPFPKPGELEENKHAFYRAELQMADQSLKKWPNEFEYIMMRFSAISQLDDSSPEQVLAAGEVMRKALRNDPDWFATPPFEFQIARAFLKKKTHVDEVPTLIEEGWKSYREGPGRFTSDRQAEEMGTMRARTDLFMKTEAAQILLDAAKQLKKPEIAKAAVGALADAKPDKPYAQSSLWAVKAKYAELEGRKLDALLMYRAAVDARPADFKAKDKDEVAENLDRLWKELGGTTAGRDLWAKKAKIVEATTEGRWEKPAKGLPPWQLADLEGKTWNLVSLEGKSLLINLWATWCGPCRMEHPYLQKLYEKTKGRSDIQIITFNVDDQVGAVAPYMKENKYTFPVLLAKNYVDDLLPLISIPRNWIVDATGKWQWEQIGFGPDEKWEDTVLEKLEKTKPQ